MIENRNINIITDAEGNKLVLINDIRFKGKQNIDWDSVKEYLEGQTNLRVLNTLKH